MHVSYFPFFFVALFFYLSSQIRILKNHKKKRRIFDKTKAFEQKNKSAIAKNQTKKKTKKKQKKIKHSEGGGNNDCAKMTAVIDGIINKLNKLPLFEIKTFKKCKNCEKIGPPKYLASIKCLAVNKFEHKGPLYERGNVFNPKNAEKTKEEEINATVFSGFTTGVGGIAGGVVGYAIEGATVMAGAGIGAAAFAVPAAVGGAIYGSVKVYDYATKKLHCAACNKLATEKGCQETVDYYMQHKY